MQWKPRNITDTDELSEHTNIDVNIGDANVIRNNIFAIMYSCTCARYTLCCV